MRRWLVTGVSALAVLGVAACTAGSAQDTSASSSSTPSPSASTSGPATPVSLRLAVYGDQQTVAGYRKLAGTWNDEHPDETVTVEAAPDARASARRVTAAFDEGDAPDVFLADHEELPPLVAQGRVRPVDDLLEQRGVLFGDNYQRLGLEGFAAASRLQCMPHDVSPLVVFYNTDMVRLSKLGTLGEETASPEDGWSWDQFTQAARQASRHGVKGLYVPPDLTTLTALVRAAGGDTVDDDRTPTTLTTSDGGNRAAIEQVLQVLRDRSITPDRGLAGRLGAARLLERGKVAMVIGTRRLVPKLRETPGLHFDVMPLPKIARTRTVATMDALCISSQTRHLPQATDFLAWASGPEGSRITAGVGGNVPANLVALHSDAFLDPQGRPEHASVFIETLGKAEAMPFVPGWDQVERDSEPLLRRMFYASVIDLDSLLPALDERSAQVLAQAAASASPSPSPSPSAS